MTTSSSPVSVASSSSAGAAGGSVIDVNSLVSQLVTATEAPQQKLIADQTATVTSNISALGTLKSALSTFQSSLTSLATTSAFNSETANTSDDTVFTATAAANALGGTYSVAVSSLASAQQILSGPFAAGSNAPVGTGDLTLSLGGASFHISVDSTNNTLSGIAAAINAAGSNPGINAAVVTGTDGAHLVLSSTQTGAVNTISVTETDGGGGLTALTYSGSNTTHYKQNSAASDAAFSIAGVPYTNASNTVMNAISGVTLTLLGTTAPGGTDGTGAGSTTLTVANDTSTVEKNISAFVDAYNTLQGTFTTLGGYDSSSGTAGTMLGNPVLTGIQNQIQHALHSLVGTSAYNSLATVGITSQPDGTLALNSATLESALSSNFGAVSQLFSGTNGVASQLNKQITTSLAGGNSIDTYAKSLTTQNNALTQKGNDLTTQMNALTASLTQQYSTLNSLLSSLQSTSSYLTQAFASLPTVQGTPNA